MAIALKQSTASQEVPLGPFVDSTDGNTAETGLTIANTDIKIWVTGATSLANKTSGGGTHMANGVYSTVLDATDTATLGPLVIFVQVAGALPVRLECVVLNALNYDSAIAGTDVLQVDVTQILGTAVSTPATAGILDVNLKNIANATVSTSTAQLGVNAVQAGGTAWGSGAITAASIAADAITAAKVAADVTTEIQSGLATAAALTTIDDFLDTEIAAIKAKTDSLTFTVANVVDANIQRVNDVAIVGDGAATPWGP